MKRLFEIRLADLGRSEHAISKESCSIWHLLDRSAIRTCTKSCGRLWRWPGLRGSASGVRVRLLGILSVCVRAVRLLRAQLLLRRSFYRVRPGVQRLLCSHGL